MEAIKRIVKTPENREIRIKIPDSVPVNDPVEVIIFFRKKRKKTEGYDRKIEELRNAMKDEHFLRDMKEIAEDFENTDLEEWQE